VKSTVETVSPTRVRLSVEVPFSELKPSLDKAYRSIAKQVRLPGFRPGKVPPALIDQRIGRAAVLEEAIQDAIPQHYSTAVREHEVKVLGQPEVEVTELADGDHVAFTAEVDVRPEIALPDLSALEVVVDDVAVADSDVAEQVDALRERFAVLKGVDRAARQGDFVSIDLAATVDGEEVPGGTATGMSYEVGSRQLLPGLDEALVGLEPGASRTFTTALVGGELAGREAEVEVTVRSVKEKELPDLDDEFAQTASEFDTVAELREDVRTRLERTRRLEQGFQARDRALEALVDAVDVPLPEGAVRSEVEYRRHAMNHQLEQAGLTLEQYLETEGRSPEDLDSELSAASGQAVKAQLVLDALADREQIGVSDAELTDEVVRRASQAGATPDEYVSQVVRGNQLPLLVADVRRGKALALVLQAVTVHDASGGTVDLAALQASAARAARGADTPPEDDDAPVREPAAGAPAL